MLEGRVRFTPEGEAEVLDPVSGMVLAAGYLVTHPGHQVLVGETGQISSAVQFTGVLTDAGRAAVAE